MDNLIRYTVRVPYTESHHGQAIVEVVSTSETQAMVEAMAQVRSTTRQPVIHDPEVIARHPIEVRDE